MNADLTIDTLSFKQVYSDEKGSLRRETSRGVNLPEELKIAHQSITDSATKLPSKRSMARFDRYVELTESGLTAPVSAYIVVQRPNDANVESADILAVVQRLVTLLQEDDSGLDLMDEIFVNGEQ
jgi:hypothetical protein